MGSVLIQLGQLNEAISVTSAAAQGMHAVCGSGRTVVDLHDVQDLVTPSLTRCAPYDAGVITCARIGLTAAAAFANRVAGMEEAHSLLREAICCLTVVQQRIEGEVIPNEVIVLVRA